MNNFDEIMYTNFRSELQKRMEKLMDQLEEDAEKEKQEVLKIYPMFTDEEAEDIIIDYFENEAYELTEEGDHDDFEA